MNQSNGDKKVTECIDYDTDASNLSYQPASSDTKNLLLGSKRSSVCLEDLYLSRQSHSYIENDDICLTDVLIKKDLALSVTSNSQEEMPLLACDDNIISSNQSLKCDLFPEHAKRPRLGSIETDSLGMSESYQNS